MQRLVILALLVFAGLSSLVFAEEWHQFRGPNANGVSQNPDLPVQWDSEKNLQWKVEIPGQGWSQPVVWGDKVFVTSAAFVEGENRKPIAVDANAEISPEIGKEAAEVLVAAMETKNRPKQFIAGSFTAWIAPKEIFSGKRRCTKGGRQLRHIIQIPTLLKHRLPTENGCMSILA